MIKPNRLSPGLVIALLVSFAMAGWAQAQGLLTGDRIATARGELVIHPMSHASLVLGWQNRAVFVDPVEGSAPYHSMPRPVFILVTDIHSDHMDAATLAALGAVEIVAPRAVRDALPAELQPRVIVLDNGQTATIAGIGIEAVPAYNVTPERLQYHPPGRGNGYVLTFGDTRVYVAGDTEVTPEMRALENIDVAFVPMNLPYTMTVEQAAEGVNAFRPRIVYPYHHRGGDVDAFARLVGPHTEVRLRDWYPGS